MAELLIEYRDVEISRQELTILKNINLKIYKGEFIYLIGRVGSGKSSLMKSMYADIPLYKGEAEIFDYNLKKIKRKHIPYLRRKIGIVFQDFQLLTDRSVAANLEFVLKATGWSRKEDIEERIETVLKRVDMHTKGYKMPHQLSGGEQQRIVIARALLNNPEMILADEPTGNLDPETGANIVNILREIAASGTSIIMATHNHSLTKEYPGRVLCIEGNELIEISKEIAKSETESHEENCIRVETEHNIKEDKFDDELNNIPLYEENKESDNITETEESETVIESNNTIEIEAEQEIVELIEERLENKDENIESDIQKSGFNYDINDDKIKPDFKFSSDVQNEEIPKMSLNDMYARNASKNVAFLGINDNIQNNIIQEDQIEEKLQIEDELLEDEILEDVAINDIQPNLENKKKDFPTSLFDDLIDDGGYVLIDDDDEITQK